MGPEVFPEREWGGRMGMEHAMQAASMPRVLCCAEAASVLHNTANMRWAVRPDNNVCACVCGGGSVACLRPALRCQVLMLALSSQAC